jgi:hypothetical protein
MHHSCSSQIAAVIWKNRVCSSLALYDQGPVFAMGSVLLTPYQVCAFTKNILWFCVPKEGEVPDLWYQTQLGSP